MVASPSDALLVSEVVGGCQAFRLSAFFAFSCWPVARVILRLEEGVVRFV